MFRALFSISLILLFQQIGFSQWTNHNNVFIKSVTSLAVDNSGKIWVGSSDKGISSYDGLAWSNFLTETNNYNYVSSIKTLGNQVWATSPYQGLARMSGGNWTNITSTANGLHTNDTYGLAFDNIGNLWVATYEGLAKDSLPDPSEPWRVFNLTNTPSMQADILFNIYVDPNNVKWIGTYGDGLLTLNGSNWSNFKRSNSGIPSDTIYKVTRDGAGNYWMATNNGVAKYNGSTWTVYNKMNTLFGLPDNKVYDITIDEFGNVHAATNNGLGIFRQGAWTNSTSFNSNLPNNQLRAIAYDPLTDQIWVGTALNGVASMSVATLGVEDNTIAENLNVYPNPVIDQKFFADFNLTEAGDVQVHLINHLGLEVQKNDLGYLSLGNHHIELENLNLTAGLYFLIIQKDDRKSSFKIIVK